MQNQRGYINFYCDSLSCFLYEKYPKFDLSEIKISQEAEKFLCEYVVLKNKLSGVSELNISATNSSCAVEALSKYSMQGKAVIDAETFDFVASENIIVHIKDILSLSENKLQDIAMQCGKKNLPVLITFGRNLNELGSIDKTYKMSPVTFLESMGFLDRDCSILGGNFLDKDELALLASYDCRLVLSPHADMFMGRGFINLSPLKSQAVTLAFASDVYPKIDMLKEGELACGQTANLMYDHKIVTLDKLSKFMFADGKSRSNLENYEFQSRRFEVDECEIEELARLRLKLNNLIKMP